MKAGSSRRPVRVRTPGEAVLQAVLVTHVLVDASHEERAIMARGEIGLGRHAAIHVAQLMEAAEVLDSPLAEV